MAQFASIARPAEGTLIARWDEDPHGTLQLTGAEAPLAKEEQDLLDGVHRFAAEVMRPIGEQLDRVTPEEVIAAGSPLWQVFTEFGRLGIGVDQLLAFEPGPGGQDHLPDPGGAGLGRCGPGQLAGRIHVPALDGRLVR